MAFGWDDAIGAAGALGSGIMGLINQGQANSAAQQQLQMAILNYQLQKQQADQQYELATAGRTDVRGNRTRYVPGYGWETDVTPQTRSIVNASDAVQKQNLVDILTRQRGERDLALNRRLDEGRAASPLLRNIQFGYGAPTKEGVVGADKIAAVTGVNENADNAKSAYALQALRSGTTVNPRNFSNIDTGATTGVRSALAKSDAGGQALFDQLYGSWMNRNANPYNMLATRASNIENTPFQPENISGNVDANMANAASVGAMKGASGSEAITRGMAPLIQVSSNPRIMGYDSFIGGLTENLKNLLRKSGGGSSAPSYGGGWDAGTFSGTGATY